ncbi:MAG: TraR/DksA family transcriptional regulator, partial [Planctomycetia bacterium]
VPTGKAAPAKPVAGKPPAAVPAAEAAKGAKPAKAATKAEAQPPEPARPRKFPKGGPGKADLKRLRARLEAMLTGNRRSSEDLEREALQSGGQDVSVDHMADHGTDSFEQDFTLGLLEGKTEMAREIQDAIAKIDGKGELPYGVCEACADRPPERWARGCETCPYIPTARLDVMPHARLCIRRQEEAEGDR